MKNILMMWILIGIGVVYGICIQSFIGWYRFEHEKHLIIKGEEYECNLLYKKERRK